jgi:hypothetical protein
MMRRERSLDKAIALVVSATWAMVLGGECDMGDGIGWRVPYGDCWYSSSTQGGI